jgi:hypothetical protein
MVLYRPNIWYLPPHIPYLLNYLLIWVKTVTYFYEAQARLPPYIPYLLNYLLIWVKTVTYFNEAQALLVCSQPANKLTARGGVVSSS